MGMRRRVKADAVEDCISELTRLIKAPTATGRYIDIVRNGLTTMSINQLETLYRVLVYQEWD